MLELTANNKIIVIKTSKILQTHSSIASLSLVQILSLKTTLALSGWENYKYCTASFSIGSLDLRKCS